MKGVDIFDGVFTHQECEKFREILLYKCQYRYGERDNPHTKPSGIVCDFTEFIKSDVDINTETTHLNLFLKSLTRKIYERNENLKKMTIYRVYVNLFTPNEDPSFHIDGENTVTCLYYLNPSLDPNEGGETQFLIDEEIKGVISKPGRLAMFSGEILHRATAFKNHPRLTLAFKFV